MTAGDENVFTRWSRRKQAVRYGEPAEPVEERKALEPTADEAEAAGQPVPEAPAICEPLPNLEDLTAESDLSAFLRKGVPEALKSAAMRKVWSLDPAIRDHVGLSEYAWDFNQPGSMTGFGPLTANESVAEFLATMSDGTPPEVARAEPLPEDSPPTADIPDEPPSCAEADEAVVTTGQPDLQTPLTEPEPLEGNPVKVEAATENSQRPLQAVRWKRHGGAVPR